MEGEVGRFRRRWLTPVPEFATLADLNAFMAACEDRDGHRVISVRPVTVGAAAAAETPELLALPSDIFEAGPTVSVKANHKAEVCVRQCYYSVPVPYAGRRVSVRIGAALIEVFDDGKRIAAHVRAVHKYAHVLELDRYLEVLTRKPGAMAGAFTATHQRFWDKARHQLGDGPGTRALIGVLLLSRTLPAGPVAMDLSEPAAAAAISAACKSLYLSGTARIAASMAKEAARARLSHQGYLAEVLTFECDEREDRRRDRRVKEARFPRPKRLEDLDLTQIPDLVS